MRLSPWILALAVLAGCASEEAGQGHAQGEPAAPAAAEAPAPRSEYSSIDANDCTLESRDVESGGVRYLCRGIGGHDLRLHDSDARMSLDVLAHGAPEQPLDFWQVAGIGFSSLGSQVEWRFAPDAQVPKALIVRFDEFDEPDRPNRPTSWLLVAKLAANGSCVIGKVPPSPAQNAQARALADVADERPCLQPATAP